MIWELFAVKAIVLTAALYRSRAVRNTLTVKPRESAPARALARVLSDRAQSATKMERMVAAKAATVIRGFVQTTAFEQAVLSTVAHLRTRIRKGF